MKWVVAIIGGLVAVLFFGMGAFDQWATLTDYRPYLDTMEASAGPEGAGMIAWAQGLPVWRLGLWGVANASGLLGGLLLLGRVSLSSMLLWIAFLAMGGGLAADLVVLDGAAAYGQTGLVMSGVFVVITLVLALLSGWASER